MYHPSPWHRARARAFGKLANEFQFALAVIAVLSVTYFVLSITTA